LEQLIQIENIVYLVLLLILLLVSYTIIKLAISLKFLIIKFAIVLKFLINRDSFWEKHIGDKEFIKEMKRVVLQRRLHSAERRTFMLTDDETLWEWSILESEKIERQIEDLTLMDINIFEPVDPYGGECGFCELPKLYTATVCYNCQVYSKNSKHINKYKKEKRLER
jgi:hypothetical protein